MELDASDSEKKQLSYLTQYFGHSSDAFVDSITAPSIDIINENLQASHNFLPLRFYVKSNVRIFQPLFFTFLSQEFREINVFTVA